MEVFVNRSPTGYVTSELEDMAELQELLGGVATLRPLDDEAEVHVEITGKWGEIRDLLAQPCFKDVWFSRG